MARPPDQQFKEEVNDHMKNPENPFYKFKRAGVPTMPGEGAEGAALSTKKKRSSFGAKQQEYMQDLSNRNVYQGKSYQMAKMFQNSLGMSQYEVNVEKQTPPNPIWMDLPKCAERIKTPQEMKEKLNHYAHSGDVMFVRYFQDNCVACGAVEKAYEFLCTENKKHAPGMKFYEVRREDSAELVKGLVRYPQVKGYSGGQWADLDFKPDQSYRDELYQKVGKQVNMMKKAGEPVTAQDAEEMYFSAAGPAMYMILRESMNKYYASCQIRLHNYFKQVSVRRTWFYKNYVQPNVDPEATDAFRAVSIMGERVELTAEEKPEGFQGQ